MVEGELVVVKMESDFSEIFDSKFSEFGVKFIIVKIDKPRKKIHRLEIKSQIGLKIMQDGGRMA